MAKIHLDTSFLLVATLLLFHTINCYIFNSNLNNFDVFSLFGYGIGHGDLNTNEVLAIDLSTMVIMTLLYLFVRKKL